MIRRPLLALSVLWAFAWALPAVAADFEAGLTAARAGDFAAAYAGWKPLADTGHARAQWNLGQMYETGMGVALDLAEAARLFKAAAASASAALLSMPAIAQGAGARVVVVGGGFAGATCARALRKLDTRTVVTLVEQSETFTACPFSNEVIAGLRELREQQGCEQAGRERKP